VASGSSRAYSGVHDLRRMQAAVAGAFTSTSLRVGELAWLTRHHTHRELALDIRLWEGGEGQLIGWTFFRSRGEFNLFVAPGCGDGALVDDMLGVIEEAARTSVAAGDVPVSLSTYGIDPARSAEDEVVPRSVGFEVGSSPERLT
jgi:hypothetical protein